MEKLDPETVDQSEGPEKEGPEKQEKNVAPTSNQEEPARCQCKLTGSWLGRSVLGIVIGGLAGLALHLGVGCPTGTCPITASPWASALYCAILGFVVAQIGCCGRKSQPHC